jgi:hypothetical protein
MGYTHYWIGKRSTDENWNKFREACEKLYQNLPEKTDTAGGFYKDSKLNIGSGSGKGKPVFDGVMVDFNGRGNELSNEGFRIVKHAGDWDFCKTARKPYDLLVVAVLIAAWQILDYRFDSDGFTDYKGEKHINDLIPGMNFYNEVMRPDVLITEDMLWEQCKEKNELVS